MAKPMLNKGFTLIEFLIVLMIISVFNLLAFSGSKDITHNNQVEASNLSNNLTNLQFESYLNREKNCLVEPGVIAKFPICFNANGNINLSQKISILNNNLKITVFLGAGKHEIK